MNIYRYTIVETGEVFEGTREQACEHFECTIGKLEGMSRRKELLREVIGKRHISAGNKRLMNTVSNMMAKSLKGLIRKRWFTLVCAVGISLSLENKGF